MYIYIYIYIYTHTHTHIIFFSMESSFSIGLFTTSSACRVSKQKGGVRGGKSSSHFFPCAMQEEALTKIVSPEFCSKMYTLQANRAAARDIDL